MSTTTAPDPHTCRTATRPLADPSPRRAPRLGRYVAPDTGQAREIIGLPRPDGSTFVVDYLASTLGDRRVVAHLAPDEPPENARIVTAMYLADENKGRCRRLTPQDLDLTRLAAHEPTSTGDTAPPPTPLLDAEGHLYRIREVAGDGPVPELRWTRSHHPGREEPFEALTLRDVLARLEDYEPARGITIHALAADHPSIVSVSKLEDELERLQRSAVVLNRRLRETVERRISSGEMDMSAIALRCGRTKRDRHGYTSGDCSWVARRIGLRPVANQTEPSRWVHSDVLALIARKGLCIGPHEVEL